MAITTKTIQSSPIQVMLPKDASAIGRFESLALLKLVILTALGLFILSIFSDSPYVTIIVLDLLFCAYLVSLFKSKYRYLFLLHPFVLFASSQFYAIPFLSGGDGEAYAGVVASYFNTQDLSFHGDSLWSIYTPLRFFKYASLGVVPIYAVPEYFFNNPVDEVYCLWQGTFHVYLCVIVITLARAWNVLEAKYLFAIGLFVVISPTCFEFNTVPSRHIVTFFGVFLLLISHLAVQQRFTLFRAVWYAIAVVVVLISKAPLMAPYFIFVFIDLFVIHGYKLNIKATITIALLVIGFVLMSDYLINTTLDYQATSKSGAATFGSFTEIPVIGWIVKYIFALLAPFPWLDSPLYINNNYRGNWFLFFMHTLSSLTGLYLFFVVILKYRTILACDLQLKQTVAFALIMSLSILKGSTGFHGYLSIYFPMLVPLLTIKKLQINPMLPVVFVIIMEAFMALVK